MGPITGDTRFNAKLAYYTVKNGKNGGTYNEVHLYPTRGEKNLNGWDEIVNIEDEVDENRTPENQEWSAFE
jgi:hypothetical protein